MFVYLGLMFVITAAVGVLLGLAFAASGASKLASVPRTVEVADHLGIPRERYRIIGLPEAFGAAGVLLGLRVVPLGLAAGAGLVVLMAGAALAHRRANDDAKEIAPAIVLAVLAAAYVLTRALTA
jgi:hypothetical protein